MNKGTDSDIWTTSPSGMMPISRRSGGNAKIIVLVLVGLVFIYGLYSYHDVHTRLSRTEEKAERLRQQHDSLSAQLQVVYEHKSRLEKSLQQEKQEHRKTKEDLTNDKRKADSASFQEKQELLNRVNTINQEHKMLQSQHEDTQNELTKAQEVLDKLKEDMKLTAERNQQEYMQLKQERENEGAKLRDEIANIQRRHDDLQAKLATAVQQNQYQQNQRQNVIPQMPMKGNLQPGVLPGQQVLQGQQQQQQIGGQQVQGGQLQGGQLQGGQQVQGGQQIQGGLPLGGQPLGGQLQGGQQGFNQQNGLNMQQQPQQQQPNQGFQQQQQQQQPKEDDQQVMQVPVPGGNKPYFQPKEAKVDHEVGLREHHDADQEADHEADHAKNGVPALNQVAAPVVAKPKEVVEKSRKVQEVHDREEEDDNQLDHVKEPEDGVLQGDQVPDRNKFVRNQKIEPMDVKKEDEPRIEAPVADDPIRGLQPQNNQLAMPVPDADHGNDDGMVRDDNKDDAEDDNGDYLDENDAKDQGNVDRQFANQFNQGVDDVNQHEKDHERYDAL